METRRRRLDAKLSTLTVLLSCALGGFGCPATTPERVQVGARTGALGVQIKSPVPDLNELAYTITRGGQPYRTGTFQIGALEGNFSVVLGGIAANTSYLLELSAVVPTPGSRKVTTCKGSAPFQVEVGQTTVVSLVLHCDDLEQRTIAERCPIVSAIRALPSEAPIGKCVILKAESNLPGTFQRPLQFEWTASSGMLSSEGPSVAKLECTEIGIAIVTVSLATTDPECARDSLAVHVTCSSGDTHARDSDTGAAGSDPRRN